MDKEGCVHIAMNLFWSKHKAHRRIYYDPISDKWSRRQGFMEQFSSSDSDNRHDLVTREFPPHSVGEMKQFSNSPVFDPSQGMRQGSW